MNQSELLQKCLKIIRKKFQRYQLQRKKKENLEHFTSTNLRDLLQCSIILRYYARPVNQLQCMNGLDTQKYRSAIKCPRGVQPTHRHTSTKHLQRRGERLYVHRLPQKCETLILTLTKTMTQTLFNSRTLGNIIKQRIETCDR